MEQNYRFGQVSGWTEKLTADHSPSKFIGELETYLSKNERPLVRLKDDVAAEYAGKPSGTTLYNMPATDAVNVTTKLLEVMLIKGTKARPDMKLLAVVSVAGGDARPMSVPVIDLRHATAAEKKARDAQIAEAKRVQADTEKLNALMAAAASTKSQTVRTLREFFEKTHALVDVYHRLKHDDASIVRLSTDSFRHIESKCAIQKIYPCKVGKDPSAKIPVIDLVFKDVKIKYMPERTPGKLHETLHGHVYTIGDFKVRIFLAPSPIGCGQLMEYRANILVGAQEIHNGLLHPHINRSSHQEDGWRYGTPCWGSYDTPIKEALASMNIRSFVDIMHDFLSSCSESGWYGSVHYWADADTAKKYCTCGAVAREERTECGACGWKSSNRTSGHLVERVPADTRGTADELIENWPAETPTAPQA